MLACNRINLAAWSGNSGIACTGGAQKVIQRRTLAMNRMTLFQRLARFQ